MSDLENLLPSSLERLAERAAHRSDLVVLARRGVRRRRLTRAGAGAATLATASVAVGAVAVQVWGDGAVMAGAGAAATGSCHSTVSTEPLPPWAQDRADAASERWQGSGQPTGTRPPHVFSAQGDFVAILPPGRVLRSPSRDGMADMVQFAARRTPDTRVKMVGRRGGTGPAVPTLSDSDARLNEPDLRMPLFTDKPGCYRLVFTWDGITRSVDLQWQPGPRWTRADLPTPVRDAVTREADTAQNKLPDGGFQPPPGKGLGESYHWVKSTRGLVTRTLGALDPSTPDNGDTVGTASASPPPKDPDQVVYVVQIPYNENDQADIHGLRVLITIGPDGQPETVLSQPDTPWTDLTPLGQFHIDGQSR